MLRNLYADIRSLFLSYVFWIAMIVILAGQAINLVVQKVVYLVINESVEAESVAYFYQSVAALLVTAATLIMIDREFSNGCIRNKIVSGVKRTDAFLTAVFGGMMQGVIYTLFACVVSTVISCFFTAGFMIDSIPEVANCWLVTTMACMAIGAFSSTLVMVSGGNKASYVIGLFIAFAMNVWDVRIVDKLFPDKGYCALTGMQLTVYRFIDRYIPYSYLVSGQRYDMGSYIIGCLAMALVSVVIGLVVFNKRELR